MAEKRDLRNIIFWVASTILVVMSLYLLYLCFDYFFNTLSIVLSKINSTKSFDFTAATGYMLTNILFVSIYVFYFFRLFFVSFLKKFIFSFLLRLARYWQDKKAESSFVDLSESDRVAKNICKGNVYFSDVDLGPTIEKLIGSDLRYVSPVISDPIKKIVEPITLILNTISIIAFPTIFGVIFITASTSYPNLISEIVKLLGIVSNLPGSMYLPILTVSNIGMFELIIFFFILLGTTLSLYTSLYFILSKSNQFTSRSEKIHYFTLDRLINFDEGFFIRSFIDEYIKGKSHCKKYFPQSENNNTYRFLEFFERVVDSKESVLYIQLSFVSLLLGYLLISTCFLLFFLLPQTVDLQKNSLNISILLFVFMLILFSNIFAKYIAVIDAIFDFALNLKAAHGRLTTGIIFEIYSAKTETAVEKKGINRQRAAKIIVESNIKIKVWVFHLQSVIMLPDDCRRAYSWINVNNEEYKNSITNIVDSCIHSITSDIEQRPSHVGKILEYKVDESEEKPKGLT